MKVPDFINGLFEFSGSIAIWINVFKLYKDKQIKGIHWGPMLFFTSWSFWNLYYYPFLSQWLSLTGGVSLVIANCIWTGLAIYYLKNS